MGCCIRSRCMSPQAAESWALTMRIAYVSPVISKTRKPAITGTAPAVTLVGPMSLSTADQLLADFFAEARRILAERGLTDAVITVEDKGDTP